MKMRWGWLLVLPLLVSAGLTISSQFEFVRKSFFEDLGLAQVGAAVGFHNYVRIMNSRFYLKTITTTLDVSAWSTFFSVAFAYPVAYTLARMRSRWSMVLLATVLLASLVTVPIKVLGLSLIFGQEGILNRWLLWSHAAAAPVTIFGTQIGVVVGLTYYSTGFAVLLLYSMIRTIPTSLEEAAKIQGCGEWRAFWRVIFPLSFPALVVVSLLVFNMSMGGFAAAALIGGGKVVTLPVLIYQSIFTDAKYAVASTLSAILLVIITAVNLVSIVAISFMAGGDGRRSRFSRRRIRSDKPAGGKYRLSLAAEDVGDLIRANGSRWRNYVGRIGDALFRRGITVRPLAVLNGLWVAWVYIFLLAPLFVIVASSFNGGPTRTLVIHFPPQRISLDWYFNTPIAHLRALGISLILGLLASLGATILALPAALGLVRGRFAGKRAVDAIFRLPAQIPFVVIALSFLYLYYSVFDVSGVMLARSFAGVFVAHVFILMPFVIGSISAVLQRFNVSYEEAALVLGASQWSTFRRVTLPIIMPGVFAGAAYAFMVSFGDVPIALFLAGPSSVPFPMLIFQSMQTDFDATILSTSTLSLIVGLVCLLIVQRLAGLDALLRSDAGATN